MLSCVVTGFQEELRDQQGHIYKPGLGEGGGQQESPVMSGPDQWCAPARQKPKSSLGCLVVKHNYLFTERY